MAIGFDVSRFFSPFRGDPLGGQQMQLQATLEGGRGTAQAAQSMVRAIQESREQQLQRQQLEQQAAYRREALASLDAARRETSARGNARLDLDRRKFLQEQQKLQGTTDADALRALLDPFRRGDLNATETARAAAQARDPSLSIALPGESRPTLVPGMASADELFGPADSLRVERGGQPLAEMDRQTALQREADAFGRLTAPLRSSPFAGLYAPALEAGMAGAGQGGGTGREMADYALEQANKEANRRVQEQQAAAARDDRALARQDRGAQRDEQRTFRIQSSVDGITNKISQRFKLPDLEKDDQALDNISRAMASDSAWQQNRGLAQEIARISGKASSDREMLDVQSSDGQWNRLAKIANSWLAGGELPAEFAEDVRKSTLELMEANNRVRMKAGLRARDAIYSSLLPFASVNETVEAANYAFGQMTGEFLTPEEMARETQRLARLRGGMGAPAPMRQPSSGGAPPLAPAPVQVDRPGAPPLMVPPPPPDMLPGSGPPLPPAEGRPGAFGGMGAVENLGDTGTGYKTTPGFSGQPAALPAEEEEAAAIMAEMERLLGGP